MFFSVFTIFLLVLSTVELLELRMFFYSLIKSNYRYLNVQAVLGASAMSDEQNIVSLETKDYFARTVKQPIISLTSGAANSVI